MEESNSNRSEISQVVSQSEWTELGASIVKTLKKRKVFLPHIYDVNNCSVNKYEKVIIPY